jgi:hypothetical protein
MPEEEKKELVEIIKEEIQPFKEEMKSLKEQTSNYENNYATLVSKVHQKDKEVQVLTETKEVLVRDNKAKETIIERLRSENEELKLNNNKLRKENVSLKKAYLIFKEKHNKLAKKLPILENKIKLAEIEIKNKIASNVEKHLKDIVPTAFIKAQKVFENKFKPIETDVLREIGSLVSPYLSEERNILAEKSTNLEKTLIAIKEQNKKQLSYIEEQENENKKLKSLLKEAKAKIEKEKLENYKIKLIESAPIQVKPILKKKLATLSDTSACKKIFFEVVKKNTIMPPNQKNYPVEEIQVSKVKASEVNMDNFDSGVPTDPEILKLAGIE